MSQLTTALRFPKKHVFIIVKGPRISIEWTDCYSLVNFFPDRYNFLPCVIETCMILTWSIHLRARRHHYQVRQGFVFLLQVQAINTVGIMATPNVRLSLEVRYHMKRVRSTQYWPHVAQQLSFLHKAVFTSESVVLNFDTFDNFSYKFGLPLQVCFCSQQQTLLFYVEQLISK